MDLLDGTLLWSWTDGLGVPPAPEPVPAEGGGGIGRPSSSLSFGQLVAYWRNYGRQIVWWPQQWLQRRRKKREETLAEIVQAFPRRRVSIDETDAEEMSLFWDDDE